MQVGYGYQSYGYGSGTGNRATGTGRVRVAKLWVRVRKVVPVQYSISDFYTTDMSKNVEVRIFFIKIRVYSLFPNCQDEWLITIIPVIINEV